ncbi:MAG: hypothetical protein Q9187_000602 [Circinaria calcarea]
MEVEGENRWYQLAENVWSKSSSQPRKVRSEVIKTEIWDVLEKEDFDSRSLFQLENLQLFEKYLWPGYNDDSSNHHVLLIALMVTVKSREKLPAWNFFHSNVEGFSSLFRRVLSLGVDDSWPISLRTYLLGFLMSAFQSLDVGIVRKECAPLVSISIWHNLSSETARETKFEQHNQLRKAWRAATKRYDAAETSMQTRLKFERSWLFSMITDFINRIYDSQGSPGTVRYCERFLEFLTDLESQLPTRRYVNALLQDMNLLALIKLSPAYEREENAILRDLFALLRHFAEFPIDDHTGAQYSREDSYNFHCQALGRLQRNALKLFKSKLTILALSNYGAIDQRSDLHQHLSQLTETELAELCVALGFRTNYPPSINLKMTRELLLEILLMAHERRNTFQDVLRDLSVLPTEVDLYEPTLLRNESYDGTRSLAIPKLNLQYLTVGDFLWRSFVLYRCESFFEIRKNMEDTIKRLQPRMGDASSVVQFGGFSRMALPISKPRFGYCLAEGKLVANSVSSILEVAPPKVGSDQPAHVRTEVALDVSSLADHVRSEWDTLRPGDVVYLLAVRPQDDYPTVVNGHSVVYNHQMSSLLYLRTAEVVQVLDEDGRVVRDILEQAKGHVYRPRLRRLVLNVDASAYKLDKDRKSSEKPDVYEAINVIVRRRGRENNFKGILESIKSLALSEVSLPAWLQEVFLGYGDPAGATYTRLPNCLKSVDFRDTFLNWQHLVECLPGKSIEADENLKPDSGPPYVLETSTAAEPTTARPSRKRRRGEEEDLKPMKQIVKVSTYLSPNHGPYPTDALRKNKTRFTPTQVEAIVSGTQPGLTVIVGPPGTGKTDVATQIINNIYHDFPSQRTLMVTHSNQALNQLFQKLTLLDIDGRHLLRLGHGEEDLDSNLSYGKHGRVESFLDNRARLLSEVDRLAVNLGAPGAHGSSCETAGYFKSVYVDPAWSQFWDAVGPPDMEADGIVPLFPFHHYFQDAPQPLFPPGLPKEQLLDVAKGCQRHIDRIFAELEDIRPFEILRNSKDKANYLLLKEARIIAMTSTHAAIRRQEIASLGFHYENVIMEEAAQITEIENFIPLALQNPEDGGSPLQRIVLCGDHLQNSPIIQNLAFRQFANLEQSLFLRLVRLGVPIISLDRQGRARPSIAELYKWRYEKLGDLPNVLNGVEYKQANAGFQYDYQFINVPDYKGAGEVQPSPHFIQNLGEAEYAVAIYQYMRLLGYPASKISILTTYAGQRSLVRDVLEHRCAKNRLFGLPRIVTTVDKYQGEQNDYVILTLVRTSRVGYLRDIRRLTVALSRARLGLYILGRREVFENCYELKEAFDRLLKRPDQLMLVPGEVFPASRDLNDEAKATQMTSVEHLGQYVYEMTRAKITQISISNGALPTISNMELADAEMAGGDAEEEEGDIEQPEELDQ